MKLNQRSQPHVSKPNYWKWEVWLEVSEADLERIDHVQYILHPSFRNNVRVIKDRASRFRMKSAGWGEFDLKAIVQFKDGSTEQIRHWLSLGTDTLVKSGGKGKQKGAASASPRVFLSHAMSDSKVAEELKAELMIRGIEVSVAADILPGSSLASSVDESISHADRLVSIHGKGGQSRFMYEEIVAARKANIPVTSVLLEENLTKWSQEVLAKAGPFDEVIADSTASNIADHIMAGQKDEPAD